MANEDNKLKGEFSYHHKLIRVYNGKGHVHRYKNRPLDCQFECVQTVEGKIFFKFDSFDPDLVINSEKVSCLSGYSDKGQYLHLNTPIFLTATNFQYTYSADELLSVEASGMLNPEEIKELKFYLTNFKFIGRPRQWRLDGHDVTIKRVENYEDVIREIQATKSVDVTVEMSIKLPYSDTTLDITRVEKLATDVCHLLSLAKGCKVQWLFWDAFSGSGHRVKSYHWAPWITPYSSMDLVVDNPPEDIDEFILATFDNFRKENSKGIWKLDEAIDHYVNSILERGLIELRALNLVALMED